MHERNIVRIEIFIFFFLQNLTSYNVGQMSGRLRAKSVYHREGVGEGVRQVKKKETKSFVKQRHIG